MSNSITRRLLLTTALVCAIGGDGAISAPDFVPGLVVLQWDSSCGRNDLSSLLDPIDAILDDSIPYWPTYYLKFADSLSVFEVAEWLDSNTCVIWAEPVEIPRSGTLDEHFNLQWHLEHLIQGGLEHAQAFAPEAWAIESGGDRSVRIAVLDQGIAYDVADGLTHPDLQNSELGYPFEVRQSGPDEPVEPASDHGTQVIGVLGANTNNNIDEQGVAEGIAGIAHQCTIASYVHFTAQNFHDACDPLRGNCDIVTSSQCQGESRAFWNEIQYAQTNNVLVVYLVGNRSPQLTDYCELCEYVSDFENFVVVGGTDWNDEIWDEGPRGSVTSNNITVSAPADEIVTTDLIDLDYIFHGEGTSLATPLVAGIAGLILSQARESEVDLTPVQVRDIIIDASDDCNFATHAGRDSMLGFGRVNAFKALLRTPGTKELESDLTIEPHYYDHDANGNDVSPYYLVDELAVPEDRTLTIQPGTRIVFDTTASLIVEGKFIAIGTEDSVITFQFPLATGNAGLFFLNPDSVVMEHCRIIRAPELYIEGGEVTVRECQFDSCYYGVSLYDCETDLVQIENNLIDYCQYGIAGTLSAGTMSIGSRRQGMSSCLSGFGSSL